MAEIGTVGVVGAGLMGHGIAWVAAAAGHDVVLRDIDDAALGRGVGRIRDGLARAVAKGRSTQEDADALLGRIAPTTVPDALAGCDLVVEAIAERLDLKLALWRELDAVVQPRAIFATNTSSLSVVEQAAATSRPERFVGLHFFSPAQVMPLVEVVRAVTTADEVFDAAFAWVQDAGKTAIAARDRPGFIVNRLLVPYLLDAIRAVEEGVGSVAEIDAGMRGGAGHPMGPLALADAVGLDTLAGAADGMYEELREPRFARPPLLRKMLAAGWLGRKAGLGFYDWSGEAPVTNPGVAR